MINLDQKIKNESDCRDYKPVRYDLGYDVSAHEECREMHREAQWFINDVMNKQPKRWLSLLGASGTGKTHLAKAIADTLLHHRKGLNVRFVEWPDVVARMRSGEWDVIDRLNFIWDILVVDDIGAENGSGASQDALYRLLSGRAKKWTVFTSNLLMKQIGDQIDVRVASRLVRDGNVVIETKEAGDYALAQYKQRRAR